MKEARVATVKGDLLFTDLPGLVNSLLGAAYPELHHLLAHARLLVFIPESAEGTLFAPPTMGEVAVMQSREARLILETRHHGGLRGFPLLCVGPRLVFRVGIVHLTVMRDGQELSPTSTVRIEFVYRRRAPGITPYLKCFANIGNMAESDATQEEAARLLVRDS